MDETQLWWLLVLRHVCGDDRCTACTRSSASHANSNWYWPAVADMVFPSGPKASPVAASNDPLFVPLFPCSPFGEGNRGTGDEQQHLTCSYLTDHCETAHANILEQISNIHHLRCKFFRPRRGVDAQNNSEEHNVAGLFLPRVIQTLRNNINNIIAVSRVTAA
jgi:hypothetical protein